MDSSGAALGWCSGAAGRAAARWSAGAAGATAGIDADGTVDASRIGAADRPVQRDLSLCHGELGIVEALTVRAGRDPGPELVHLRRRRAGLVLDAIGRHGPYCGVPGGVATSGLLTGLAGIGYGLLRLGFADQVPSVLLLEPAPATGRSQ